MRACVCACVHGVCVYLSNFCVSTISQQTESTLLATPLPNFASTPATQPHRPVKGAWLQPATHPVKPAQKETDCKYTLLSATGTLNKLRC